MNKKAVILGGAAVVLAAVAGGGFLFLTKEAPTAVYWDGKSNINALGADGSLPLFKAVAAKDAEGIKRLLEKGANAQALNKEGTSALEVALKAGDEASYKVLVEAAQPDFRDAKYLAAAIYGGNAELVKDVLDKGGKVNGILEFKGRRRGGEEVNYMDARVVTPLKAAINSGNAEVAQVLLERGAEGASYFFTNALLTAKPEMLEVLSKHTGGLRGLAIKGMDVLSYGAGEANLDTLAFLLKENAGNVSNALQRVLSNRKRGDDFDKVISAFVEAGAQPNALMLEQVLNKRETETFYQLLACVAEPNMFLEQQEMSLLEYAIDKGYHAEALYLLEKGAVDIWAKGKNGYLLIERAIKKSAEDPELLAAFIKKLDGINDAGYDGETLLMLLAKAGNYDEFQKALAQGADLWAKDNEGKNVLMYAQAGGENKIIDYILAQGENLGARDKMGRTALMYAAKSGNAATFGSLFSRGAKSEDEDDNGKSVLMYAAEGGNAEIIEKLINAGESAAASDKNEKTVLMYAAESGSLPAVQAIINKGVAVDLSDRNGVSALMYAAKSGNVEIAKLLRQRGANIYAADKSGRTALVQALERGNQEMFYAVSMNEFAGFKEQLSGDGTTLLMYAVKGKNPDLIRLSINKLRDILNRKDRNGRTVLMMLVGDGRADFVREALMYNANPAASDNNGKSVLMYAAEGKSGVNLMSVLQKILGAGDVNRRDNLGRSALMYAVSGVNAQAAKQRILLRRGAEADMVDNQGRTVLMYAVGNQEAFVDRKAIEELLAYGKNVEAKDNMGRTALMYAAENKNLSVSVLEALVNAGALVRAVDNDGRTALMYAAKSGDISKFRLLLDKGALATAKDKNGLSALDYAKEGGKCFAKAVEGLL